MIRRAYPCPLLIITQHEERFRCISSTEDYGVGMGTEVLEFQLHDNITMLVVAGVEETGCSAASKRYHVVRINRSFEAG